MSKKHHKPHPARRHRPSVSRLELLTFSALAMALLLIILYQKTYPVTHQTLWSHEVHDSYTLQAIAWWKGQLSLDQNYSWLELAQYRQKIYVSFPPVPSVLMFLLVPLFKEATPNNLVVSLLATGSVIVAAGAALDRKKTSGHGSALWGIFLVSGCSLLPVAINGGVWYQAQWMAFFFSLLAARCVMSESRRSRFISPFFLALAVGCRPLMAVWFPWLMFQLYRQLPAEERGSARLLAVKALKTFVLPALIACALAAYNLIRFGNPLEFGHNYLPEFLQSPDGQFNLRYILPNLRNILRLPVGSHGIEFPRWEGFAFWLANPLYILFGIRLAQRLLKQRCMTAEDGMLALTLILHMTLTLTHKTLGGWQFGARYFADMLPFVFLWMMKTDNRMNRLSFGVMMFATVLNVYGTLWFYVPY